MKNKLSFSLFKSLTQLFVLLLCFTSVPSHAIETITYYHTDSLGSPVAGTDTSGALLWKEDYKPYGERIRKQVGSDKNTRWYTGHTEDKETGLTYAGARFYDSVTGRFLAIDPVGFKENNLQMFNRYAYANNNPYKYVDPDGKAAFLVWFLTPPGIAALEVTGAGLITILSGISLYDSAGKLMGNESSNSNTGTEDDLLKNTEGRPRSKKKKKEKTEERDFIGGGGFDKANEEFDKTLKPKNVNDQRGGVRTGELDNGTRVTVRPKNSPSIDIRRPGSKKPIKVRF